MGETAGRLLTVDEFLAWDDGTDRRHQLLRGRVTIMAPAQAVHGALVARLAGQLALGLPRSCAAISEAGIRPAHHDDTYYQADLAVYQADLAVTCRPLEPGELYLREPVLVIEVLSPSTEATDRLMKLDDYRLVPSIQDILFVATQRIQIEHWHREGDVWVVASRGPAEQVDLGSLGFGLDVDALYAGLPLGVLGATETVT